MRVQARARDVSHEEEPPYAAAGGQSQGLDFNSENSKVRYNMANRIDQIRETLALIPLLGIRIRPPIAVDYRQSGPRPDPRLLHQAALEDLTRSARTDSPRKTRPEQFPAKWAAAAGGGRRVAAARKMRGGGVWSN
ncbi:hypothetical protein F511_15779 [Dorcoceras hygrometricum]|nr:hypothetical protein F511_15779 [Dorcoceras hygrometricum]